MDWIWLIVALLVGLAVGGLVAWTVVKRRYGDRESVVELRTELDRYKGKVTDHFVETADLVNTLTRNYKRVYDHLEAGAYELVGEETLRRELDAPAEAPVLIEYLGQRRTGEAEPRTPTAPATAGVAPEGPAAEPAETPPRRRSIPVTSAGEGDGDAFPIASEDAGEADDDGFPTETDRAERKDAEDRTPPAG